MRDLTKLHQRLATTFIYVTHDQVEAMTMASRIAVMKDGLLQQIDTPQVLYDHPHNVFVAGFIGSSSMNFFDATLVREQQQAQINSGGFRLPVPMPRLMSGARTRASRSSSAFARKTSTPSPSSAQRSSKPTWPLRSTSLK